MHMGFVRYLAIPASHARKKPRSRSDGASLVFVSKVERSGNAGRAGGHGQFTSWSLSWARRVSSPWRMFAAWNINVGRPGLWANTLNVLLVLVKRTSNRSGDFVLPARKPSLQPGNGKWWRVLKNAERSTYARSEFVQTALNVTWKHRGSREVIDMSETSSQILARLFYFISTHPFENGLPCDIPPRGRHSEGRLAV